MDTTLSRIIDIIVRTPDPDTNIEVQMTHEPLMNLFSGIPASNKTGISTTLRTLEPDSELTSLQETPTSVSLCPPQPGRIHVLRHPSVP